MMGDDKEPAASPAEQEAVTAEEKASLDEIGERIAEEVDEPAAASMPQVVTFETSMGAVVFDHPGHADRLTCDACHPTEPPVKIALDKDAAHALCKGCHQEQGAGPTGCSGCHQKE